MEKTVTQIIAEMEEQIRALLPNAMEHGWQKILRIIRSTFHENQVALKGFTYHIVYKSDLRKNSLNVAQHVEAQATEKAFLRGEPISSEALEACLGNNSNDVVRVSLLAGISTSMYPWPPNVGYGINEPFVREACSHCKGSGFKLNNSD